MICMDGCAECYEAATCSLCEIGYENMGTSCVEIDSTCYGDSYWDDANYKCICNNPETTYDATTGY